MKFANFLLLCCCGQTVVVASSHFSTNRRLCLPTELNTLGRCMIHLVVAELEFAKWEILTSEEDDGYQVQVSTIVRHNYESYDVAPLDAPVVFTKLRYRSRTLSNLVPRPFNSSCPDADSILNSTFTNLTITNSSFPCEADGPPLTHEYPISELVTSNSYMFKARPNTQTCQVLLFVSLPESTWWLRGKGHRAGFEGPPTLVPSDFYELYRRSSESSSSSSSIISASNQISIFASEWSASEVPIHRSVPAATDIEMQNANKFESVPTKLHMFIERNSVAWRHDCDFLVSSIQHLRASGPCQKNKAESDEEEYKNSYVKDMTEHLTELIAGLAPIQGSVMQRMNAYKRDCYQLVEVEHRDIGKAWKQDKSQPGLLLSELWIADDEDPKVGEYRLGKYYFTDFEVGQTLSFVWLNLIFPNVTISYFIGEGTEVLPTIEIVRGPVPSSWFSFSENGIHFVTCAGEVTTGGVSFQGYISAFEPHIWLLIVISGTASTIAYYRLGKGRRKVVVFVYQILLEQGSNAIHKCKWLTSTWILVGIVLSNLYRRDNINQLIAPLPTYKIQSFEEIAESSLQVITLESVEKSVKAQKLPDALFEEVIADADNVDNIDVDTGVWISHIAEGTYNLTLLQRILSSANLSSTKVAETARGILGKLWRPQSELDKYEMGKMKTIIRKTATCQDYVYVDLYSMVIQVFYKIRNILLTSADGSTNRANADKITLSKEPLVDVHNSWLSSNLPGDKFTRRIPVLREGGFADIWQKWEFRMLTINQTKHFAANYVPVRKVTIGDNIISIFIIYGFMIAITGGAFLCEVIPSEWRRWKQLILTFLVLLKVHVVDLGARFRMIFQNVVNRRRNFVQNVLQRLNT